MRYYLISDNVDTIVGMRLAGIQGDLVHEAREVEQSLSKAMAKYVRDAIGVKI